MTKFHQLEEECMNLGMTKFHDHYPHETSFINLCSQGLQVGLKGLQTFGHGEFAIPSTMGIAF
jgi:hypothetical protein